MRQRHSLTSAGLRRRRGGKRRISLIPGQLPPLMEVSRRRTRALRRINDPGGPQAKRFGPELGHRYIAAGIGSVGQPCHYPGGVVLVTCCCLLFGVRVILMTSSDLPAPPLPPSIPPPTPLTFPLCPLPQTLTARLPSTCC